MSCVYSQNSFVGLAILGINELSKIKRGKMLLSWSILKKEIKNYFEFSSTVVSIFKSCENDRKWSCYTFQNRNHIDSHSEYSYVSTHGYSEFSGRLI